MPHLGSDTATVSLVLPDPAESLLVRNHPRTHIQFASFPTTGLNGESAASLEAGAPSFDTAGGENVLQYLTVVSCATVESKHPYLPNTLELWRVTLPGATCYRLRMDPQSWTPEPTDYVKIFAFSADNNGELVRTQVGGWRLYKRRLLNFPETTVNAEMICVSFRTDGDKQAWGFRLYISKC